jgi:uncharacterized protein (TIGR02186 family)
MSPRRVALLGILACGIGGAGADTGQTGARSIPLIVEPTRIEIGLLYSGADVTVTAETGPDTEVAVLLTGPSSELVMREQARRWGLFWAPAGEVSFESVPTLYRLRTTVEPEQLAPAPLLDELGIGYASLTKRLGAESRADLARELILLKESEGLFSSTVTPAESVSGDELFRTRVHVPARAPAGSYVVRIFAFRERRLTGRAEETVELEQAGFVAFVSSLAKTHGLAYGIFAVVVAVAAGLLVGVVFGSTRKKT